MGLEKLYAQRQRVQKTLEEKLCAIECESGLRNELKRATETAKKEYLENICNEIMEFQRTGRYDLMYMKTKELGWNETQGIQGNGIEDSQGNRIIEQRQVLKIWENYITELYDRPNRPES